MDIADAVDLRELGRGIAAQVARPGDIEDVDVLPGDDSDGQPVYHFWFRVNERLIGIEGAKLVGRIGLLLKDDMSARGATSYPVIHFLDEADWPKRPRA